jgi:hypothetical protein
VNPIGAGQSKPSDQESPRSRNDASKSKKGKGQSPKKGVTHQHSDSFKGRAVAQRPAGNQACQEARQESESKPPGTRKVENSIPIIKIIEALKRQNNPTRKSCDRAHDPARQRSDDQRTGQIFYDLLHHASLSRRGY